MADITDELPYEVLKTLQEGVSGLRDDMRDVKQRLTSLEMKVGILHADLANQSARMDRIDSRLERVETRLGLVENAQ